MKSPTRNDSARRTWMNVLEIRIIAALPRRNERYEASVYIGRRSVWAVVHAAIDEKMQRRIVVKQSFEPDGPRRASVKIRMRATNTASDDDGTSEYLRIIALYDSVCHRSVTMVYSGEIK